MAFWRRLLEGTSWQSLIGYVSPAFFQLVSPRDVSRTAYRLIRNWFDDNQFRSLVQVRAASVAELDCGLSVSAPAKRKADLRAFASEAPGCADLPPGERTGEKVLTLFFHQIYAEGPLLLDLRRVHFCPCAAPGNLRFIATPLYCTWSPSFRMAVRELYTAFYTDTSAARLSSAFQALGISPAAHAFEQAFGGERKHAARFQLAEFRTTFHEVFLRCLEARATLQPEFLTLGIAIATLYDHLELDGGTYDVAACHARAVSGSTCATALRAAGL
jgi:hypothetical protein